MQWRMVADIFKLTGNLDTVRYERPVYFQFRFFGYETSRMACNSTGYLNLVYSVVKWCTSCEE